MRLSGTDLVCVRGGREVFAGLSFSVSGGEALMVTGPNGSGKSSLLRTIAGLLRAASGRLALEGGDGDRTIAEQAHYLGHQDALKPSLTVLENLAFWAAYLSPAGAALGPGLEPALAATGLESLSRLPAGYLSAGQRRRLSLARLLAVRRPIWFLDEPNAALDTAAQQGLAGIIRNHMAGGGLIIAAVHGSLGIEGRELRLGGLP